MALFIVRVSESGDRMTRTRLPGDYGDGQKAMEALEKLLAAYDSHGRDDQRGYWARDKEGREFRFEIGGA